MQSAAFDRIAANTPGVSYVRGKKDDKLASSMPDERGQFQQFLESLSPIRMSPIEPASHIAQAVNFGNSIGSVVYDYDEEQKGNLKSITTRSKAFEAGTNTVYVSISGYSEVGTAIIENLRTAHGLKELSNAEIADYISSVKIKFESGKDYSSLFWKQEGGMPQMQLSQIGPVAIPLAPPVPIVLPPLSGSSSVNTKAGSIIVSTTAIAQEVSATIAPNLVLMSHVKKAQSSGKSGMNDHTNQQAYKKKPKGMKKDNASPRAGSQARKVKGKIIN